MKSGRRAIGGSDRSRPAANGGGKTASRAIRRVDALPMAALPKWLGPRRRDVKRRPCPQMEHASYADVSFVILN
jgi:hypothetical protein